MEGRRTGGWEEQECREEGRRRELKKEDDEREERKDRKCIFCHLNVMN